MRAGPKRAIDVAPLSLRGLPRGGPERVSRFVHRYLKVPRGVGAGKRLQLRPWQLAILDELYTEPRPRAGLVSLPRGNGKTALAAALALYHLFGEKVASPQVLCVASDERQAGIVFGLARRMVELEPRLAERCHIYRDAIRVPHTDGELRPLPAQAAALQGYDPTFTIVDELHVVTPDVWEAVTLAAGKRPESLTLAISTPAGDREGIMWRLVEHGRRADDPSFRLVEYAAPEGCDVDDEAAWAIANPALGDFLAPDALRATLKTSRESSFRRYRLGQWVGAEGSWMPWDAWQACAAPGDVAPFTPVVLGFDGSASGDSTALVGCTLDERPHVFVVDVWANPGDPRWRVPRGVVDDTVAAAFARWDVRELAADPWGWRSELEAWSQRWPGRIVEWPTNIVSRMGPATDRMYAAVMERQLTHDGDERLAAHIANAVAKTTAAGDVITKDARQSPRKIDAAVAAIVALDRAAWHYNKPTKPTGVLFL